MKKLKFRKKIEIHNVYKKIQKLEVSTKKNKIYQRLEWLVVEDPQIVSGQVYNKYRK